MLNLSNIFEMLSIWNSQTFHSISVPPLLEMFLERTATPIRRTATNLTFELFAQPVKLIKPVGYRFPVPPHRQRLRVVLELVLVV